MAKRKMKMPKGMKAGKGKRMAKAAMTMMPTKGTDQSKSTAPKMAAPMSKPMSMPRKKKAAGGYRDRMDAMEM